MKKSLIALAIASAVSAPAFAATSNVDIYGKLHMSVSMFDDQQQSVYDPVTGNRVLNTGNDVQISSNASRIGFKGAEDLGGGLSAIWQVESGFNLDEQNGTWANRNSFVGLKGGFGTVLLGNHDTPYKQVGRAVDLFGDTVADSRNVLGGGSLTVGIDTDDDGTVDEEFSMATSDMRADNVLAYISPSFGGFSLAAAYSTDPISKSAIGTLASTGLTVNTAQSLGDQEDMSLWSLSATYANGPLYIAGAYSDGDALEAMGQDSNWRLAAGFTFGNAKIVGQYDKIEEDNNSGFDYDAWMVGGSYTMGAIVLKANYMEGEFDDDDAESKQWAIGVDYNLSKRTSVYALYVAAENTALGWGAGSSDVNLPRIINTDGTFTDNEDVSAFSVGVMHSF